MRKWVTTMPTTTRKSSPQDMAGLPPENQTVGMIVIVKVAAATDIRTAMRIDSLKLLDDPLDTPKPWRRILRC